MTPTPPKSITTFTAAVLLAQSLVVPAAAAGPFGDASSFDLPDFGDSADAVLSPVQEKRLGQAFMRYVRSTEKVVSDSLLNDYIQSLGKKLTTRSKSATGNFTFFLVDDPSVNAFAGPAGQIGVHTGLILTSESESELAAVLAHEIAHVTQKHLVRTFEAASRLTIPQAAVLLAAAALGAVAGGPAGVAAMIGGQAALIQEQINFTRGNEQEADRVGMQILADSSFDPRAMPAFFERMGRATRAYATVLPEFLRTHPVTTSRIADAQGRAEKYPYRQVADDRRYYLARAALRVQQARTPDEAIQGFRSALSDHRYRDEPSERYGLTLALMRARQFDAARREIDRLRGEDPTRVEYIVTSARLHVRTGQTERGIAELEQASSRMPGSYPVRFELGDTLLAAGKAERAAKVLEPLAKSHADNPQVMRLMAQAAGQAGRRAEGHQYMAEYYYLTGAVDSAVLQLEIGLKQPGVSFYQSSVMEARLAELKKEAEELKKEKKKL